MDLDSLPREIKGHILRHLPYEHVVRVKCVSKAWKALIESEELLHTLSSLRETPTLTACYFFFDEDDQWQWAGFDPATRKWRRLPPPLMFLPRDCAPEADLFKQFLLCTDAGLVTLNFSKSPDEERLIVLNPLSGQWRELPPLIHRRNPVLMHMRVDPTTKSYQILVAGSCRTGDEASSRITELLDSRSGAWERVRDVLGPAFALNEFQSGVHHRGTILCIGFVEDHDSSASKGIMRFNLRERTWRTHCLPNYLTTNATILQMAESHAGDVVYLFSETENGRDIYHCIHKLEWMDPEWMDPVIRPVMRRRKSGGRSLELYPEVALVPYSDCEVCVYNTIDHSGEVYGIDGAPTGEVCKSLLPALPDKRGFRGELGFSTLNPLSFTLKPRFSSKVY